MISFTGTKSDAISVDTDWTKANLSSIDTISVDTSLSGDGSETGDVYTLYNFGTASHLQLSEVLAKDQESHKMADIVLRIGRDNKDLSSVPTTIEYMPVSALVICCDTEVDDAESRSLERSSVNEQPFLRIKGFKDESSIKEPPVKYSFLVRDENDAVKELKYVDSEAISAGGSSISGDANLTAVATDSIERVYDGDLSSSYLRLYQFDDPDIEEVRNVLPENEDYTLEDPDGYEMVALYRRDGVLSYAKI